MNIKVHINQAVCMHHTVGIYDYCYFLIFEYIIVFKKNHEVFAFLHPTCLPLIRSCGITFFCIFWGDQIVSVKCQVILS